MASIDKVKYWCYKVLPLVYDDSLSYYEVLCKVVEKLNELVEKYSGFDELIEEINDAIAKLQKQLDDLDTTYIETLIKEKLTNMIYVRITDAGYIVYYIPDGWEDITFNTIGLDISNEQLAEEGHVSGYDYGTLMLSLYTEV